MKYLNYALKHGIRTFAIELVGLNIGFSRLNRQHRLHKVCGTTLDVRNANKCRTKFANLNVRVVVDVFILESYYKFLGREQVCSTIRVADDTIIPPYSISRSFPSFQATISHEKLLGFFSIHMGI
jgi:hypothetical protein